MDSPIQRFVSLLDGAPKRSGNGYVAKCPAHDDKHPSLSVSEGEDGRVLLHCFAGCEPEAICAALGIELSDLFEPVTHQGQERILATYDYHSADGQPLYQIVRRAPKNFRVRRRNPDGGWTSSLGGLPTVIYRLPQVKEGIARNDLILVLEGEKDVDQAVSLGFVATCNPFGANKWRNEHSSHLKGADVVVIPDNDEAGMKHARDVATKTAPFAERLRMVELPDVKAKGDFTDWVSVGGTREQLLELIDAAPDFVLEHSGYHGFRVSDVEPETVRWLWPGRVPFGKLTIVDGDPGIGKSTMICDVAASVTTGRPLPTGEACEPGGVVFVCTEDGIADTIRPRLEAAGANLHRCIVLQDIDGRIPTIPEDLAYIAAEVGRVNASFISIDPLFAHLDPRVNSYRDQDVRAALAPVSLWASEIGAAVVCVRHPIKQAGGKAIHRGGGSIGIIGAARSGLFVGRNPDDYDELILAPTKSNLGKECSSLSFRIVSSTQNPDAGMVKWTGTSALRADQLTGSTAVSRSPELDDAKEFLHDALANGRRLSREICDEAKAVGIAKRTLNRAKAALQIASKQDGSGWWFVPPATWHPAPDNASVGTLPKSLSSSGLTPVSSEQSAISANVAPCDFARVLREAGVGSRVCTRDGSGVLVQVFENRVTLQLADENTTREYKPSEVALVAPPDWSARSKGDDSGVLLPQT